MQIQEAIEALKNQLGIACDADGDKHSEASQVGRGISGASVEFDPSLPSIQTFLPGDFQEQVRGGNITVGLAGDRQPEAARTLDEIITPVLNEMGISTRDAHRYDTGNATRIIKFSVPEGQAGDFVGRIIAITRQIEQNPQLHHQFRLGMELSMQHINRINAKPFVRLKLGKGFELEGDQAVVKPPYFQIIIEGTPEPLAKKLTTVSGQDFAKLRNSPGRTDRTRTRYFSGGKTFSIAMDDPHINEVMEAIKNYANLKQQFMHDSDSSDRSPH